jgi:MYB-related transcription factor LHY
LEIEIPPPRPKRKPSTPYPRKTTTSCPPKDTAAKLLQPPLDLEKEPPSDPERPSGDENLDNTNKNDEIFLPFQEVICGSLSCSASKISAAPIISCAFKEFGSVLKEVTTNQDEPNESYLTAELSKGNQKSDTAKNRCHDTVRRSKLDDQIQADNVEAPAAHNYPRHVPVHVVDRNKPFQFYATATSSTTEAHSVSISSSSSVYQQSVSVPPTFHHPFFSNETFSSLVLSALVQNPAAHAAATIAAATLYPSNIKPTTAGPPPPPSMTSLAAATVAAATAWWAAHGLLPSPAAPFSGNLVSAPPDETQSLAGGCPQDSKALMEEENSSDSDRTADRKQQLNSDDTQPEKSATVVAASEVHDSNKSKSRKQVDRSSCGSNTASSSEVETDALGNHENGKEELKEPGDATTTTSIDSNRRGRISSANLNDSWKEVSQGGRRAFQALFSRERLPQSFSPQQKQHVIEAETEKGLQLDLNSKIWGDGTMVAAAGGNNNDNDNSNSQLMWRSEKNGGGREEGMVTTKMMTMKGVHNNRTAAFKPYKRCSVEANKESRVGCGNNLEEEHNSSKRMRLEGGASA